MGRKNEDAGAWLVQLNTSDGGLGHPTAAIDAGLGDGRCWGWTAQRWAGGRRAWIAVKRRLALGSKPEQCRSGPATDEKK